MTTLNLNPIIIFLLLFYIPNAGHSQAMNKSKDYKAITHEYADVNGVKLHYATAGKGKKLIMFVHGFPEFWYQYRNQLQEFSKTDEYTVIAPDMRGYNLSSKPDSLEKYQIKYMVEDLRQLSEKLGYKKFTLVAHDWGGGISWWFAITHPEYLDKLIIINMAHPATFQRELNHNPEQQKGSSYFALFRTPGYEQTLSANNYEILVKVVLGDDLKARNFTEADKEEYLKAWSQPGALTAGLNYYRANESYYKVPGLETHSHRVEVPTLVIWGEKDQALMKSNLDGLEQYIPDLTIKRIPEGSHWVIHEYPELVNKYIEEFVK